MCLEDGTRHLVVNSSPHVTMGRRVELFPLDSNENNRIKIPVSLVKPYVNPTATGKGSLLRALLANRKTQEIGGGGLALRCNTKFKAFQYRPLVKFQGEAAGRLLIADETGLGKTIETGYILVEEFAAGRANRVLIMVPKRTMNKWKREMRSRFGIILEEASRKKIEECVNNREKTFHLICSHDVGRKSAKVKWWEELNGSIDLLVIDEVHNHIGLNSKFRRPMAEALSDISDSMLVLTATPVRKDYDDLFRILELICPGISRDMDRDLELNLLSTTNSLTRALESEDWDKAKRLCEELENLAPDSSLHPSHPSSFISSNPPWNPDAIAKSVKFLRGLPAVSRHITRARGKDPEIDEYTPRIVHPTHWITPQDDEETAISQIDEFLSREFYHIHRQQLSSCRPAILELMNNGTMGLKSFQRDILGGNGAPQESSSGAVERECERLARLLRRIKRSDDAKFSELEGLLTSLKENPSITKTVIFTHFHPTFRYLRTRLERLDIVKQGVKIIYADPKDDSEKLQSLNDQLMRIDGFAILLATDRMSEGVDLHAANCVINYDLPYNPQDIQQRIGRVDRIVQEADEIHVHNFAVKDTVDVPIMAKIVERSRIFEAVVGGMETVTEEMHRASNTRSEVNMAMANLEGELDQRRLIETGEEFRFVDRVWDDSIKQARISQSPFLDREHYVILEAFERLNPGAGHTWDDSTKTLSLVVDYYLSKSLVEMLGGYSGLGPQMSFELIEAAKTGILKIRFGGSSATIGPVHPFNKWATNMLSSVEGCKEPILEISRNGAPGGITLVRVEGATISDSSWLVEPANDTLSDWFNRIEEGKLETNISPLSGDISFVSSRKEVQALIDRERAEYNRLKDAKIRRLHAIKRRLEEEEDDSEISERIEKIDQELDRMENEPIPEPAKVNLVHQYIVQ